MSNITADLVKELRLRTGSGMMECKKALVEAQGDLEKAEDILAASGAKKAANSATRVAAQGVASAMTSDQRSGVLIEVNCETDFVAKDASFKEFVQKIAQVALDQSLKSLEDLLKAPYRDGLTVESAREALVLKIGENIQLRRLEQVLAPEGGCIGAYVHGDRIAVLIALNKPLDALAKDLAMQVAAMRPQYIELKDIPESVVNREKAILVERSKEGPNSKKPTDILEKILDGQLNKYLNELCLVGQAFVKNPDETVGQLLQKNQAQVLKMVRFEVGEGIVVEKKSFRDEVMEQIGKA